MVFQKSDATQSPVPHNYSDSPLRAEDEAPSLARILVVDGGSQARAQIASVLEVEGYSVQLASGGHAALELLEQGPFDLVLTDMMMLDGSGLDLLERIRRIYPALPVVMVTALNNLSVAVDAMRRGACDYLVKPLESATLLNSISRALDRRHELQENQHYKQRLEKAVQARTELLRQAVDDLEHSYDITLEALGDALDLKDAETEGHSKRVTAYTIALARAIGLSSDEIKVIARGAFLHDIGKMAIPDKILLKPGKLTPEEQVVMREHAALGYRMVRKIPFLDEAAQIVHSHQEHYDGTGYPRGLRGTEIPIGARIFAIADTLDAITCDRPYRKAQSFDAAKKEIRRCAGTQFDPGIVEIFLRIPNELWYELRDEITSKSKVFSSINIEEWVAASQAQGSNTAS